MTKHSIAYRARRKRMRDNRKVKALCQFITGRFEDKTTRIDKGLQTLPKELK